MLSEHSHALSGRICVQKPYVVQIGLAQTPSRGPLEPGPKHHIRGLQTCIYKI